jgi:hypothetical protein
MKGEALVRISEVSRRTGVSIRSLRYYEQRRLLCARRLENGYRDLDEEVIVKFSFADGSKPGGNVQQSGTGLDDPYCAY